MKKIEITKKIISTIVGLGTSTIVKSIIENNVDTDTNAQKVTVTAASAAIGFAASDAMSGYTDSKIDEIVAWWSENVTNRSK